MPYTSLAWIIGIAIGLIIAVLLIRFFNTDKAVRTKYDERQQIIRGRAYRVGFYTTLIANGVILVAATGPSGVGPLGYCVFFIPIMAGLVAQISYSIFKDAYIGLNTNIHRFAIIMVIIGAFNMAIAVIAAANGELIRDGYFQGPFINLLCGALFIIIGIEFIIKKVMDSREE